MRLFLVLGLILGTAVGCSLSPVEDLPFNGVTSGEQGGLTPTGGTSGCFNCGPALGDSPDDGHSSTGGRPPAENTGTGGTAFATGGSAASIGGDQAGGMGGMGGDRP